jgi:hypothetical protein
MKSSAAVSRKLFGLFTRKERWGLSGRGWAIVFIGGLLTSCLFLFCVYPFLAVTDRTNTNVLVVEGWIHEYAIRAAVEEFRSGSYQRVFTTGGPVEGSNGYVNDYQTSASVGGELLKKYGLADESLQMVPSRVMDRNRTYGSAIALRNWFRQQNLAVPSVNVLTENVHARRTRLLFQEALGKNVEVGIIAVPDPSYDPGNWWRFSQGTKDVFNEWFAYLYARLLFHPSDSSPDENAIRTSSAVR